MAAFVLDASMTAAWHFRDEETTLTAAVEQMTLDFTVVVPGHWFAEVANALLVGERRRRATPADSARFVERLGDLTLIVDDQTGMEIMTRLPSLARAHDLTIYDALYLELAGRRGLPLASLDNALNDAARRVGIALLGEAR